MKRTFHFSPRSDQLAHTLAYLEQSGDHEFVSWIGSCKQATLATVAPGISEALVATAIGLFAAIPAVIAYNRFNAKVDSLAMTYENFSDEFCGNSASSRPSAG